MRMPLPHGQGKISSLNPSLNPVNPVKKLFSLYGCGQSPRSSVLMTPDKEHHSSSMHARASGILDFLSVTLVSRRLSMVVPVLYMGLVLMGASIPAENGEEEHFLRFLLLPPTLQNLVHIPAYALLAFFWRWCLAAYARAGTAVVLALVLTIGFGVFQEFYQTMIPGRYGSWSDVLFDAIGAIAGLWVFSRLQRRGLGLASRP
jgi:hypothetical protein